MSDFQIGADSSMSELMSCLPGGKRALFAKYHLGGCSSCAFSDTETLRELCERSGLQVEEVLAHLLVSHEHDRSMWVSPAEVKLRREDYLWVDIRTREEFDAIPLAGAEFCTQEFQQNLFSVPPGKPILLFDHRGAHVLDRVAWFRGHGLKDTYGLLGGIDAWAAEADPGVRRYRLEVG